MRTTQRRVRRVLDDLGATSRFPAGMNAHAKGLALTSGLAVPGR
jgi:hypothetical protein